MIEAHPDETELVQLAFGDASLDGDDLSRHVADCAECRGAVDTLRTQANALRLTAASAATAHPDCLDDETIAMLGSGDVEMALATKAFAHLLDCEHCRHALASVARLFEESHVRPELARLERRPLRKRTLSIFAVGGLAAVAAAAVFLFILSPEMPTSADLKPRYRELSFTASVPPTLVAPIGEAVPADTFRWRAVTRANRYRITVFNRDGSVAWERETRDTAVALPTELWQSADLTFLWRVDARVGWEDRWAASEMAPLTLKPPRR